MGCDLAAQVPATMLRIRVVAYSEMNRIMANPGQTRTTAATPEGQQAETVLHCIVARFARPRGEFHTFCCAGPMFAAPIAVQLGEAVLRDGFWFVDLLAGGLVAGSRGSLGLKPTGGNRGNGERLPSVFSVFSWCAGTKVETETLPSGRMSHPLGRWPGGGRAAMSLGEGGGGEV